MSNSTNPNEYNGPDLRELIERVKRLQGTLGELPKLYWGIIEETAPLILRDEIASVAFEGRPSTIVDPALLAVGDRVLYSLQQGQVIIHGQGGGIGADPQSSVQKVMLTSENVITSGGAAIAQDGNIVLTSAANAVGFKDVFEPGFDYEIEAVIQANTPVNGSLWMRAVIGGAMTTATRFTGAGTQTLASSGAVTGFAAAGNASLPVASGNPSSTQALWYESRVKAYAPADTVRTKYGADGWCITTARMSTLLGYDTVNNDVLDGIMFISQAGGNNILSARISVKRMPGMRTYG